MGGGRRISPMRRRWRRSLTKPDTRPGPYWRNRKPRPSMPSTRSISRGAVAADVFWCTILCSRRRGILGTGSRGTARRCAGQRSCRLSGGPAGLTFCVPALQAPSRASVAPAPGRLRRHMDSGFMQDALLSDRGIRAAARRRGISRAWRGSRSRAASASHPW